MKTSLIDSDERRHFLVKRLETIDSKIQTIYTGVFKTSSKIPKNSHKHTFLEIMLVTNGKGIIEIENEQYSVERGNIIVYFPDHLHREWALPNQNLETYFFSVKYPHNLKQMFEKAKCKPIITNVSYKTSLVLFKSLIDESKGEEIPYTDKIVNCLSKTIILKILQASPEGIEVKESNDIVTSIKSFLDEHYTNEVNLDDFYKELPVSKFYCSRLFKQFMGITPSGYVISKRMEKAKELIATSDMKIGEISQIVGYKDIYYFSKVFKKEVGVFPLAYRKGLK